VHQSPFHFLVFTPQQEEHEIPALMAHYLLRKNGHRVTYAGAGRHPGELEPLLERLNCTHLFFHMVTNLTNNGFEEYFSTLTRIAPDKTIVCSGPGVQFNSRKPNTIVLRHIEDMITFSQKPAMFSGSGVHSWQHRQP
jgi:MerR family transcriptional regulator, light-induced transcriptional regulator